MKKISLLALSLIPAILLSSCNKDSSEEYIDIKITSATQTTQTVQTVQTTEATTQPIAEVVELIEYDINKVDPNYLLEYVGLDFLSEEQKHVFQLADFVYGVFDIDLGRFFDSIGIEATMDKYIEDTIFFHTGFTYESVLNSFLSVLSEEIVSELMEQRCANLNGEFVCGAGARGGNCAFMGTLDFEPIEVTDDIVKFKALAGYGDPNMNYDKIISYEEVNFEMQKIDGRWIVTKFEMWV